MFFDFRGGECCIFGAAGEVSMSGKARQDRRRRARARIRMVAWRRKRAYPWRVIRVAYAAPWRWLLI